MDDADKNKVAMYLAMLTLQGKEDTRYAATARLFHELVTFVATDTDLDRGDLLDLLKDLIPVEVAVPLSEMLFEQEFMYKESDVVTAKVSGNVSSHEFRVTAGDMLMKVLDESHGEGKLEMILKSSADSTVH